MRPLWLFIFSMMSVVVTIFLFIAWFGWSMADFDCADGYFECRRNCLRNEGVWVAGIALAWLAAAIWLYRTRKKQ